VFISCQLEYRLNKKSVQLSITIQRISKNTNKKAKNMSADWRAAGVFDGLAKSLFEKMGLLRHLGRLGL